MKPSKKKVLIVVPSFDIGGTIVSLHSLLSVIDVSKYEIDLFALTRKGVYLSKMPNCRILPENIWLSFVCYHGNVVTKIVSKCLRITRAIVRRLGGSIEPILCRLSNSKINFKQYDTIVNYSESAANIVCHYPAQRRVAWVHCDYRRYLTLVKRNEKKVYERYNTVVCVSEFAKSKFCDCLPQMTAKTVAIHNVINADDIKSKAQEPINDPRFITDCFTIVSAGRLDPVKQFHLIPKMAAEIKKQTDKKFVWYIIGGDRGFESYVDGIKTDIVDLDVSEEVVMLGEKRNVYPYMAKADLYVSTSLSESFPLVINEAKALGIPIVSNNFGSATESIEDGVDGFVVPVENMQMVEKIIDLFAVNKPILRIDSCDLEDKNKRIMESIYSII